MTKYGVFIDPTSKSGFTVRVPVEGEKDYLCLGSPRECKEFIRSKLESISSIIGFEIVCNLYHPQTGEWAGECTFIGDEPLSYLIDEDIVYECNIYLPKSEHHIIHVKSGNESRLIL